MREGLPQKILMGLFLTGAIVIALTSPYALINIARACIKRKEYKNYEKRKISQALSYLKRNRLVILKEENETLIVELTEKGKRRVKQYQFQCLQIAKPKVWDGKWRIVIFDIPEKKKKIARDALREKLKKLNFFLLQKSVWVHPYPCENEIQLIAEIFEVTPYIQIILADTISNDVKVKAHFKLL